MFSNSSRIVTRLCMSSLQNFEQLARFSVFSTVALPRSLACQNNGSLSFQGSPVISQLQIRNFAARKGTRTRKEKKKVKKEIVKRVFVFNQLQKQADFVYVKQRPVDDLHLELPVDDVYFMTKFRTNIYAFSEAVQYHQESHHPTVFNVPDAPLLLRIDVDLKYPNRPNKCQDGWKSIIEMKEPFILDGVKQPTVLAFCPDDSQMIADTLKAGADLAGSIEIIKSIQDGEVNPNDYEYIVSHPSIVTDLTVIRGLMKKKFPSVKLRTVSVDVPSEVRRLKSGINVRLYTNDQEPDYGFIETPIGKLNMGIEDLEANFISVLKDTLPRRVSGKKPEDFVIRCSLKTEFSSEVFKIDVTSYINNIVTEIKSSTKKRQSDQVDEEDDVDTSGTAAETTQKTVAQL